jgi:hypothetical protein
MSASLSAYSKPSLIRSNCGGGSPGLVKQKVILKDKKKHETQTNGKLNDISSADASCKLCTIAVIQ